MRGRTTTNKDNKDGRSQEADPGEGKAAHKRSNQYSVECFSGLITSLPSTIAPKVIVPSILVRYVVVVVVVVVVVCVCVRECSSRCTNTYYHIGGQVIRRGTTLGSPLRP